MSKGISHFNDFKVSGLWWFPEKPESQLLGTLSYSPKGDGFIRLTLYDNLQDKNLHIDRDNIPNLLGFAEGKIYSCVAIEVWENPSHSEFCFRVRYIVQGQHISEIEPLFQELKFESVGILEYLSPTPDYTKIVKSNGKEYAFLPADNIEVDGVTFERKPTWKAHKRQFSAQGNVSLQILSKEENKPLDFFSSKAYRIRQLIDLLSGSIAPIEYIFIKDGNEFFPLLHGVMFDVDRVTESGFVSQPKKEFIRFQQIEGLFPQILETWLSITEELKGTYHRLYRALRGNYIFFEDRFFSLSQSLETLHTISNPLFKVCGNNSVFNARCMEMLEMFHKKYPELDKFNTHEWQVKLPEAKTLGDAADEITEFRNQFTHPIDKNTGKPKPRKETPAFLEKRLKVLLYVILFDRLGLPENLIQQFIQHHTS